MDKQHNLEYLLSLVSEQKRKKVERVIQNRTRYVTVVLENIEHAHNASAVVRSCDIFGVQDVNIITSKRSFALENGISKGASKWVDLYRYDDTVSCVNALKKQGYKIVATTPHKKGYELTELPVDAKQAIFFGTEISGLSKEALELADEFVTIPMFGFTESFNISVSVSIFLYQVITKLHNSSIEWRLSKEEKNKILILWLQRVLGIIT